MHSYTTLQRVPPRLAIALHDLVRSFHGLERKGKCPLRTRKDSFWLRSLPSWKLSVNGTARQPVWDTSENGKNPLAPDPKDMLAFRQYTQRIWSQLAARPISEHEADEIIETFGWFLHALLKEDGRQA